MVQTNYKVRVCEQLKYGHGAFFAADQHFLHLFFELIVASHGVPVGFLVADLEGGGFQVNQNSIGLLPQRYLQPLS